MAFINDIVIDITRGTQGLAQKSFRPLILRAADTTATALKKVIISELTDLTAAGFTSSDDVYKMAAAMLAQSPSPVDIMVVVSHDPIATTLDALRDLDDNFYAVCITSRAKADLNAAGTWANANKKFFFGCSSDLTALSSRNVDRESYLIHDNHPEDYPECAWVGQNIPKQPGSTTFKWKRLNGQNASTFSKTDLTTIRTSKGQALQALSGAIYVNEGIATSGEFIDVIVGQDWVEDQLNTGLLSLFLNNDKVSLDDSGIAQVEGVVRDVLKRAGDAGIIAKAVSPDDLKLSDDKVYMNQVFVPTRSQLSVNDRANRQLSGIKFVYYLAGAIHKVNVNGLITV
ncbi:PF11863 domain protein [Leptospira fainei serovar Hurstbridge str. BUT 6]|uniref:PF11863 domain protein n=1 Tax=Leptospira fainei serovar Hurstbridge str. BUT 6 TaxID=1193011 RepID=S3VBV5_9LEPT|nr:DUF3383 family protein [Leptospira fainei]EPG73960.1 PF11863 domain protein [Leptospira fainei serovar Hurstbridge str. BUT 6]